MEARHILRRLYRLSLRLLMAKRRPIMGRLWAFGESGRLTLPVQAQLSHI